MSNCCSFIHNSVKFSYVWLSCSASNYLLGMTPLEIPAFMTGTVAGMTVWGCVYASIGGAGRTLLKSGVDLEEVVSGKHTGLTTPYPQL